MSFSIKKIAANTKDLLMTVIIQYRNSGKYRLQIDTVIYEFVSNI